MLPDAIEIISRDAQVTTAWSGGTTNQIAMYPADANYAERRFLWRLSTATVDVPETVFTPLPGISRVLMMLAGEMTLQHEGHHQVDLKPFESDCFSGRWTTRSYGCGRDFNLMFADGCEGTLQPLTVSHQDAYDEQVLKHDDGRTRKWIAFYCWDTSVHVTCVKQSFRLEPGDVLVIHQHLLNMDLSIDIQTDGECESHIIRAVVVEQRDAG